MTWQVQDIIRDDNGDLKFKTHDAGTISSVGEVKQSVLDMTDEMTRLFNELYEMLGDAVDEPKAHTLLARLKGIKDALGDTLTVDGEVQLKGSTVTIGSTTYQVADGYRIRGKAADKPDAANAHAAIPNCVYWSVDTGDIEVTDGIQWRSVL